MRNSNWKAPVPSRLKRNGNGSDNGHPDDRGDDSQDGQDMMAFAETAPADLANMNMDTTEPTGPAFADSQPMFDSTNESNFTDAPPAESVNLENAVEVNNCESTATGEVS